MITGGDDPVLLGGFTRNRDSYAVTPSAENFTISAAENRADIVAFRYSTDRSVVEVNRCAARM
jgi:hypothetical protein